MMNRLDAKIALRTFLKGRWYNGLNLVGLAIGLAAFMGVTLYVDHETSYDQWNKNRDRIFLVEREMPNGPSPYTPGRLAEAIKRQCPEVELTGRINTALFQIPFFTTSGRFLIKKWVGADYSIATIFGIQPKGFQLNPLSSTPTMLLSPATAKVLFPADSAVQQKTVQMISPSGPPVTIAGVARQAPGNTHLEFDCIGFSTDITSGKDQSYATQIYQTYLLLKPNADIGQLTQKIDQLYRAAAAADTSQVARQALSRPGPLIYLDPLANLHLKPHYGSAVSSQIVNSLTLLALILLILTGVNFTNLYIAQADKRAKEVGIKKVNGIGKSQLLIQFLAEIFIQCLLALTLSFGIVLVGLPYVNQLLGVNLLVSGINLSVTLQLVGALVGLTLLAGLYPALILAGVQPAQVLKGALVNKKGKFFWVRGGITLFQFAFAIGLVINLLVVNQQVTYMKTQHPGFTPKHVVYIDNLGIYNDPQTFELVRNRIKAIPGVNHVTVATNVPGGIVPATHEYSVQHQAYALHTIGVDAEYFETLAIRLTEGQLLASGRSHSTSALINETAAKAMGLSHPVGTTVRGCGGAYRIIGVTKDVKSQGFEQRVHPTIYLLDSPCGLTKTQILIQAEQQAIPAMLTTLRHQWQTINTLDGDNFNYHFLDELYGQLFAKQEQLQGVLLGFSVLVLLIGSLGFFASAAYAIRLRMKELAIRKVFGARGPQLVVLVSKPFFYLVLGANGLAWPVSYLLADRWLETFAYRIDLSVVPFVWAMGSSVAIVALTVCWQVTRAVRLNPVGRLRS